MIVPRLVLGALLLLTAQADEAPPLTIYGGKEAKLGMFKSVGYLYLVKPNGGQTFCGATLIDREWALTAAHCLYNSSSQPKTFNVTKAVFGKIDKRSYSSNQRESYFDSIVHESYNYETHENDIALLHLKKPIELSDYVQPEALPVSFHNIRHYKGCQVAGWGQMGASKYTSFKLRYGNFAIYDDNICMETFSKYKSNTMLCVGTRTVHTCPGDSGGPLYCNNEISDERQLVGIVSFGRNGTCDRRDKSVFTKVEAYKDWIQSRQKQPMERSLKIIIILNSVTMFFIVITLMVMVFLFARLKRTIGLKYQGEGQPLVRR